MRAPGDRLHSPETGQELRVAGVLERSGTSDDSLFFVPLRTAQRMFGQENRLTAVAIRLRDPALLRQLVMILLDNALKFTTSNGVIRVQVLSRGKTVALTVADEGIGIRPDQLSHVLERFYRGDPSRTRGTASPIEGFDGAGLGLSIAQWITNEHDGTITIESQPGQGTRVAVHFPHLMSDAVSSS